MTPTAYPLTWPAGWPKTEVTKRERGAFKTSLPAALNNLKRNVSLMGGTGLVLSSNYTLGAENPKDCGVCAYFTWQGLQVAIPCDRWLRVEHNVQAIALTLEAMRGMERWGAKHMIKAMFTGFKALPAPTNSKRPWWQVLGVEERAPAVAIKGAYLELVKRHHPDTGGKHEEFVAVQDAFDTARRLGLVV